MRFLRELKRECLIGLFSELTALEVRKAIGKREANRDDAL
jgi:hypothetical protein